VLADDPGSSDRRSIIILCGLACLVLAGLLVYSVTRSFAWDEGFHLLAAQLILRGKRPYLDFFLAQTPLYAYWNAFWFRWFGDTWRTAHTFSTLMTGGAFCLLTRFVYSRFPKSTWRLPVAVLAMLFVGVNTQVMEFGTLAQAYGVGLFGVAAAFCLAIRSVDRAGWHESAGAGFFAGAAAACTLLTAPFAPVLFLWILWRNRVGGRLKKAIAFLAGGAVPFLPLFWLFVHGPQQVIFGAIKFHLFYRQVEWEGSTQHNLEVMIAWLDSGNALLIMLLAAIGFVYIHSRSGWERERRQEFYLCAILTVVETAYLFVARPTFPRYYLFVVPFAGALAAVGFFAVSSFTISARKPWHPTILLASILIAGAIKDVYDTRDRYKWNDLREVAQKVNEVTSPNGLLWSDEFIYFLTRRPPPSGFEYDDTHKLILSPELNAKLHIIPQAEVNQMIAKGKFDTIQSCDDEDVLKDMGLPGPYKQLQDLQDCYVYWNPKRP